MRLIDADKVAKEIAWLDEYDFVIQHDVMECINKQPTVDAVEVVRCKDCKWYERKYPWNNASTMCSYLEYPMDDNDYCSLGERRKDETN